jgi:flagellar hook-length control protein FliK
VGLLCWGVPNAYAQETAEKVEDTSPKPTSGSLEKKTDTKGKKDAKTEPEKTLKTDGKKVAKAAGKTERKPESKTADQSAGDETTKPKAVGQAKDAEPTTAETPKNAEAKTVSEGAKADKQAPKSTVKSVDNAEKPKTPAANPADQIEDVVAAAERRAREEGLPPELIQLSREVASFSSQVAEYRADVRRVVQAQYDQRRARIKQRYARLVSKLSLLQRERRLAAIARFEYLWPSHPNLISLVLPR